MPIPGQDKIVVKTEVIAKAFRFLDESERPKEEEEKAGKRRGKGKKKKK